MSSIELHKAAMLAYAAENLMLEVTKMAIYNLELSLIVYGESSRHSTEASHRLRDVVGPMKHG